MTDNIEIQCQYCTHVFAKSMSNEKSKMVIKKDVCPTCREKLETLLANYDKIMELISCNTKLKALPSNMTIPLIEPLPDITVPKGLYEEGYYPIDNTDCRALPPKEE